jgi:putative lipoprotein
MTPRAVTLVVLVCLVGGCVSYPPEQVKGTASYLERMALPPGAVFEATLEDVSRAEAPAEVIGSARIEQPGNPPIAFVIPYDASRIDSARRYAVRARIVADGRLLFTTDQYYPLASEVTLTLRRVAAAGQRSDEPLENTYWKLVELGGAPVTVAERQREPHFILHPADKRVSGSGGCNRFTGGYELQGYRLSFKQMAGTMMACPTGMDRERAFLDALQRVARTRIKQQQLDLLDASGGVAARFEAVHLR